LGVVSLEAIEAEMIERAFLDASHLCIWLDAGVIASRRGVESQVCAR